MGRLEGRVVLITGAAQGQGAAEVSACIAEGAEVVATDVDEALGRALADETGAEFHALDVSSDDGWQRVVGAVVATHGRIDGLVNNAGIFSAETLLDGSVETTRRIIEINQLGTYLGMKRVAPVMPEGSSIVNISSIGGMQGVPAFAYASTKWAVRGMTKSAANELASRGIRVNSVHPGLVDTAMLDGTTPERRRDLEATTPMGRIATADDIAGPVVFLLSDESGYMTGAELVVDGGLIA